MAGSIRVFAVLGSLVLLGVIALTGVVSAATPACVAKIAGTYYRESDFIMTLARDNSMVGQYSRTTREAIGLEESFTGRWTCSGNNVSIQQFNFLVVDDNRMVERGNATGTFNGSRILTLTYTFNTFPENASGLNVRNGTGTVVNVPALSVYRVSIP